MNAQDMVREFHMVFGAPNLLGETPRVTGRRQLRYDLISEETEELRMALNDLDVVETADALADIVYVAYGAALEFGIDLDAVLAEVHSSNMRKTWDDGKVHRREDGKVLKPPYWEPPNIAEVLNTTVRSRSTLPLAE